MPDITKLDIDAQDFFHSLPINIQESIMMSNVNLTGKDELVQLYENLISRNENKSVQL